MSASAVKPSSRWRSWCQAITTQRSAFRMALGALPGHVARMVISEAFGIVAGGLAIGVPAAIATALAARTVLAGVLFELSPTDPRILSSAAVAILVLASLAAYVPARRASRIDPVAAVKYE
jgi:ABC-type antimicrobial peptide transport system permease subunit